MKVLAVVPRGYCKGVVQAISLAKQEANSTQPVYILGMIVHNQFIVNALTELGITTIDQAGATRKQLLEQVENGTIIITAHGASDEVFELAKAKGLNIVDATCQDVVKTHTLIKDSLQSGYEVLYIGKNGHPEAEGALSIDVDKIHLIETKEQLTSLDPQKKYLLTNQTTMSLYDVYDICEYAKTILPNITIAKEICNATKIRQEAITSLPSDIDVTFIVGDPHSNNTKKLSQISSNATKKPVYMIESVQDITPVMLSGHRYAAVSAGASTPTYLTNQVIKYLEQYDSNDSSTHALPVLNLQEIL